ncbi:MAG: hypothetical protein OEZ38_10280, partial [Gammaproteobacteria bacterium]|nr:hypothetical protein [Gammaproteobacteria bacterium]
TKTVMNKLTLVIPGLLGPFPELQQGQSLVINCPVLEKWLACGQLKRTTGSGYFTLLADLLGINHDYDLTSVSALTDGYECLKTGCLRADPVHFKTDIDHAILIDHHQLLIQDYEAEALVDVFNNHFFDDGIELHIGHTHRWYLSSDNDFTIESTALPEAVGRNVQHFLPRGADALNWKRILNETQMLFHTHEVNQQREAKGQLTINSLWLWGEGQTLRQQGKNNWQWVYADDEIAEGLAHWAELKHRSLDQLNIANNLPEGNGVIVLDQLLGPVSYGDLDAWVDAVEALCQQWLPGIHAQLKTRKITFLDIYFADGRYLSLTPGQLYKFWRRKKPVSDYLSAE